MGEEPVSILAVDDVEENLVALSALIDRRDVVVRTARSGNEALELLLETDVALALVDVQMPEMNGFELAELMRGSNKTRHIPIIFLTAGPRDSGRVFRGYEAGAVDFLFKPLDPYLLRSKVDVFVQLHRQQRQLAAQLETQQQMLRMSDMFIAVLGHDLRNPLTAIRTGAELLLKRGGEDPSSTIRTATRIKHSSDRMTRMIEQLLDFARSRVQGGIPLSPTRVDIQDLTRHVISELEASGASRVRVDVLGDTRGTWDPDRLAQVVSNLVGNALRHGAADTAVNVRIDGGAREDVSLEVHNEGAMPNEVRETLFDPFRRPEASSDGLGIGLYIVQQIVHAHRGRIEVTSSPSIGTKVRIALPRHTVARVV